MSSLAAQLAKIGTADRQGSGRATASFLLDAREAADLDIDAVFAIGVSGYAELLKLQPDIFSGQCYRLFTDKYKSYDRILESKEENKKLDGHIAYFFQHVSPYFLSQAAAKSIEWLLRRFRVNEFNVDFILGCILPYHETNEFARMANLLRLQPLHPLYFLTQYRKPSRPLPRSHLLQHILQDEAILLEAIIKPVSASAQAKIPKFRAISAYAASFLVLYIREAPALSESVVATILIPYLQSALAHSDPSLHGHRIAAMMVLAALASRVPLSVNALRSLLQRLVPSLGPKGALPAAEGDDWLLSMIQLCASQPTLPSFAAPFLHTLLAIPKFITSILPRVAGKYVATPFLRALAEGLAKLSPNESAVAEHLRDLILAVRPSTPTRILPISVIRPLIHLGISAFVLTPKHPERRERILLWLRPIATRWGPAVGAALRSSALLPDHPVLAELPTLLLGGGTSESIDKASPTSPGLLEAIGHADASIRLLGLKRLAVLLAPGAKEITPAVKSTLARAVRDRFSASEDKDVATAAASLPGLADLLVTGLGPIIAIPTLLRACRAWSSTPAIIGPLLSHLVNAIDLASITGTDAEGWALVRGKRVSETLALLTSLLLLGGGMSSTGDAEGALSYLADVWRAIEASPILSAHPLLLDLAPAIVSAAQEGSSGEYYALLVSAMAERVVDDADAHATVASLLASPEAGAERAALAILSQASLQHASRGGQAEEAIRVSASLLAHLEPHFAQDDGLATAIASLSAHIDTESASFLLIECANTCLSNDATISAAAEAEAGHAEEGHAHSHGDDCGCEGDAHGHEEMNEAEVAASLATVLAFPVPASEDPQGLTGTWVMRIHTAALALSIVAGGMALDGAWSSSAGWLEPAPGVRPDAVGHAIILALTSSAHAHTFLRPFIDLYLANIIPVAGEGCDAAVSLLLSLSLSSPSASIRARSLHLIASLLKATPTLDWQLSIPLILIALEDPSPAVREAAGIVLFRLAWTPKSPAAIKAVASRTTALTSALYGPTRGEQLRYVDAPAGTALAKAILATSSTIGSAGNAPCGRLTLHTLLASDPHSGRILLAMLGGHLAAAGPASAFAPGFVRVLSGPSGTGLGGKWGIRALRELEPVITLALDLPGDEATDLLVEACASAFGDGVGKGMGKDGAEATALLTSLLSHPSALVREAAVPAVARAHLPATFLSLLIAQLVDEAIVDAADAERRSILRTWLQEEPSLILSETSRILPILAAPPTGTGRKEKKAKTIAIPNAKASTTAPTAVTMPLAQLESLTELAISAADRAFAPEVAPEVADAARSAWVPVLPATFDTLALLPTLAAQATGGVDGYFSHLLLTLLLSLLTSCAPVITDSAAVRVDVVVRLLQDAKSPQTRRLVLRALSALASTPAVRASDPTDLLALLMPVFTFMGGQAGDGDDLRTFSVLEDTLSAVIPSVIQRTSLDGEDESDTTIAATGAVIRVFTSAYAHIPAHRRPLLFSRLIHLVGPRPGLARTIGELALRVESAVALADLLDTVSEGISPLAQLSAVLDLLHFVVAYADGSVTEERAERRKAGSTISGPDTILVRVDDLEDKKKERRWIARTLHGCLHTLSVSAITHADSSAMEEELLDLVATTTSLSHLLSGMGKAFRPALTTAASLQSRAQALLPLPTFVRSTEAMLAGDIEDAVRRKALLLLNERIERVDKDSAKTTAILLPLLSLLIALSEDTSIPEAESKRKEEEATLLRQTALVSLALLARKAAPLHPARFLPLFPRIMCIGGFSTEVGGKASSSISPEMRASTVICLTVYGQELGGRIVPHLPALLPQLTATLQAPAGWVRPAILALWDAYVPIFASFLSPYLRPLLDTILVPEMLTVSEEEEEIDEEAVEERERTIKRTDSLLTTLATGVPPRLLLPILQGVLADESTLTTEGKAAFYTLLTATISSLDRASLNDHHRALFHSLVTSLEGIPIPGGAIQALVQLVLKLSGSAFRPLFLYLVEWGRPADRRPALYRTLYALISALQGLMLPYLPSLLDDLVAFLEDTRVQFSGAREQAWPWAIRLLHQGFIHAEADQEGQDLWSLQRLERLVPTMVAQLPDVAPLGSVEVEGDAAGDLVNLTLDVLSPALVQLSITSGSDVVWKTLNSALLLQTRDDDASVRLASLQILIGAWSRLGEEWLVLLPETIPFLAELMEDGDARVETAVQELIAQMEKFLGEPMQKYFE